MTEFDKYSTDILYYKPLSKPKWGKRSLVCWPAFAYKVVAPQPKERAINILQKTVLGLCNIGSSKPSEVSEKMNIDVSLIDYIQKELRSLCLIDNSNFPTERGKKILEDEKNYDADITSGYIFQDAFSKKFWNRFIPNLSFAEKTTSDRNHIRLKISKKSENVYFAECCENNFFAPTQDDIHNITKTHKKLQAKQGHTDFIESKHEKVFNLYKNAVLISKDPIGTYWLASWFYIPQNGSSWNVYDPFGLEIDWRFRETVLDTYEKNPVVEMVIDRLVEDAATEATLNYGEILEKMHKGIAKQIYASVGKRIKEYHQLYECLIKLKTDEEMLKSKERNVSVATLKSLANNIHLTIEELFTVIAKAYPTKDVHKHYGLIPNDSKSNKKILENFFKRFPFDQQAKESFVRIPVGQIQNTANSLDGRICVRFLVNLLNVKENKEHPLFGIANRDEDILSKMIEIEQLRNKSLHSSDKGNLALKKQYLDYAQYTYRLVNRLLPDLQLKSTKYEIEDADIQEMIKATDMIETKSEMQIKSTFGTNITNHSSLFSNLVNLESAYTGYKSSGFNKFELHKVIMCFIPVLESVFELINKQFMTENICKQCRLSDRKRRNAQIFQKLFASICSTNAVLPESISHVNYNKIKIASKGKKATLNAYILVSLMGAYINAEHPLRILIKEKNGCLDFINELQQDLRQKIVHSNQSKNKETADCEIEKYYKEIVFITKLLWQCVNKNERL